ncbi:hypothetical protein ACS5PU_01315 [Pedobacter sp. GSP4]|uniref:hypothetical protein n=1 Tax=Pedobacter sp. GSP4 TaxID=3453716 RepID=UPI003EEFA012
MNNKDLKNIDGVTELMLSEVVSINGGSEKETGFWEDAGWLAGAIVRGCIIFATEGGRNAGLCVR